MRAYLTETSISIDESREANSFEPLEVAPPDVLVPDAGIILTGPHEVGHAIPNLKLHLIGERALLGNANDGSEQSALEYTIRGLDYIESMIDVGAFPSRADMKLTPKETDSLGNRWRHDDSSPEDKRLARILYFALGHKLGSIFNGKDDQSLVSPRQSSEDLAEINL